MSAQETKNKMTKKNSTIDPLYQKLMKSVIRSIGSSEFYEFFMDAVSRADNEFQFSNRKIDKVVDLKWVEAIEATIPAFQAIVASPRNVIREEEIIVNVAHAKKGGSDVVRHLAQHGQLVQDFDESTGDVRPSKLMQKYREDSEELYENRLAFTAMEMAYHFVKLRYDALLSAMGEEFGAKLKVETHLETAVELMECKSYMHIKQKDSALDVDSKNGDVFARIERLNRLLTSFINSPYGLQMSKLSRVKGKITKTNVLKKNPHYRTMVALYDFLKQYDDVGYVIKVTEQNPHIDDVMIQNIFHNVMFQYIVLKGYLEDEEDRQLPTPLKQRKKKLKPKVIKEIIEEITDDYDVPDLEIRKVLIEELTKEQLMLEEAEERRRLVEEQERRKREEEEYRKKLEEAEAERKRKEAEAEAEKIRLQQEEEQKQQKIKELEQKLDDERRKNIFMAEIDYFNKHLYDHLDERSQLIEANKESEKIQDYSHVIEELEAKELAVSLKEEAEREKIRVQLETKQREQDDKQLNPYLEEIRYYQINLPFRRQMRKDAIEEERKFEEIQRKEKPVNQQKATKKWRFFG